MKKIFFNKVILLIFITSLLVFVLIYNFSVNKIKFYDKNKDNIVVLDATIYYINEQHHFCASDVCNDSKEYVISLSYTYNGTHYTCRYWKTITGNSLDELHYKVDDTIKIAILSNKPSEFLKDSPEDIKEYLASSIDQQTPIIVYGIIGSICVYFILVFILCIITLFKKIELGDKLKKYTKFHFGSKKQ